MILTTAYLTLKWQWAKASSRNGAYRNIEDAESSNYKPVDDDKNSVSYLRATASYTDAEGSGKSAMGVSEYAVQASSGHKQCP